MAAQHDHSKKVKVTPMLKWFMLTVYITLCCYVMWSFCRWTKKIYLPKRRAFNIIVCGLILIFAASIFLGKFLPENDYQLLILRFSNYWIGFLIYLIFFILTADLFFTVSKASFTSFKIKQASFVFCISSHYTWLSCHFT